VEALQAQLRASGVPLEVEYRPTVAIQCDATAGLKPGTTMKFQIHEINVKGGVRKAWWNFDGSGAVQSTEFAPSYTFEVEKTYEVSLLVEDRYGKQSRVMTKTIRVGSDPVEDVELDFDFPHVEVTGRWEKGRYGGTYWRRFWHDQGTGKGDKEVVYRPILPRTGHYLIAIAYYPRANHATNVPITVRHADGQEVLRVDQQEAETVFPFKPLGLFRFEQGRGGSVVISNAGTTEGQQVMANNVRWLWQGENP
jgi:PKD repeat protein